MNDNKVGLSQRIILCLRVRICLCDKFKDLKIYLNLNDLNFLNQIQIALHSTLTFISFRFASISRSLHSPRSLHNASHYDEKVYELRDEIWKKRSTNGIL